MFKGAGLVMKIVNIDTFYLIFDEKQRIRTKN